MRGFPANADGRHPDNPFGVGPEVSRRRSSAGPGQKADPIFKELGNKAALKLVNTNALASGASFLPSAAIRATPGSPVDFGDRRTSYT
jgi:hypothetical protein